MRYESLGTKYWRESNRKMDKKEIKTYGDLKQKQNVNLMNRI